MSYLIAIIVTASISFPAGAWWATRNQPKIQADLAKVKDISSKL